MLFVHSGHFVSDGVYVVEAVFGLQIECGLEKEFAQYVQTAILALVSLDLCEGVKRVFQVSVNPGVKVSLINFDHALLEMIAGIRLNELILVLDIALLSLLNDYLMHMSHLLQQTYVY